jgi:hypothetical protein
MHISLDAALQRQPLLSTVGDKLLPTFPGAAAAYSLRALNGDANNVARVRRDGDDAELDFTAEGVSFELEDWVNGKLEDTLPADVDTAAAAYSLRKVRDAYTGNALQIRRASDDVEVNVAFDANGEVSASSAITNIPVGNFPTSVAQNRTGAARYSTFTTDGLYSFSAIANSVALGGYVIDEGGVGDVVTVSFDLTLNSGSINSIVLRPALETGSDVSNSSGLISSSGSYSFDLTATDAYSVVAFIAVSANFTVSNVSIQVRQDAGDTTATTLGGFLTEESDIFDEPNFSTDEGELEAVGASLTFDNDSVSDGSVSKDDCLEVDVTSASNAYVRDVGANLYSGINNVKIRFEADFYAPSTNTSAVNIRLQNTFEEINGGGSQVFFPTTKGAWTSVSVEGYPNQNALQILVLDRTVGDVYYFANMKISIIGHDGKVVTWYDQSGNGYDATQDTAEEQPKIAEAGSLLTNGKGDTVIDCVDTDFFNVSGISLSGGLSIISVLDYDSSDLVQSLYGTDGASISPRLRLSTATDFTTDTNSGSLGNIVNEGSQVCIASFYRNASDSVQMYLNSSTLGSPATVAGDITITRILARNDGATDGLNSGISELIFFNSDQSDNRFKIESNINNHYGIYTPAYNGFVENWYDQSGNGNNAEQPSTVVQPKIVVNGSLCVNSSGKPAVWFERSSSQSSGINFDVPLDLYNATSFSVVEYYDRTFAYHLVYRALSGSGTKFGYYTSNNLNITSGGNNIFPAGVTVNRTPLLLSYYIAPEGQASTARVQGAVRYNAVLPTSSTSEIGGFGRGDFNQDNAYIMLSEMVYYESNQLNNVTAIESNIADEYGITLS